MKNKKLQANAYVQQFFVAPKEMNISQENKKTNIRADDLEEDYDISLENRKVCQQDISLDNRRVCQQDLDKITNQYNQEYRFGM